MVYIDIFSTFLPLRSLTFEKRVREMDASITIFTTRAKNKEEKHEHVKAWKCDTREIQTWYREKHEVKKDCEKVSKTVTMYVCATFFYLSSITCRQVHVQLIFFYFPSSIPFYKESYFTRLVNFVPLKFEVSKINRRDLHLTIFRIMFINLKKSVYRITWKSFGLEHTRCSFEKTFSMHRPVYTRFPRVRTFFVWPDSSFSRTSKHVYSHR